MAHELSTNAVGQVEAAFAGEKPWHGLGTMVPERMTPGEAVQAAHLDWAVVKRPLWVYDSMGKNPQKSDTHMATVRADNGKILGIVGKKWEPIQNTVQADFISDLTDNGAVVECVGALREGKRTFWTCKLPQNLVIGREDEIERYLILANGHDGMLAFRAFWSPIRVVCQNTLSASLRDARDGVALYHTLNVGRRVEEARHILGLADEYYQKAGATFNRLLEKQMNGAEFKLFAEDIFKSPVEDAGKLPEQTRKARERVTANFEGGRGHRLAGRTAWGAFNAVTEYVCHQRGQKSSALKKDKRFESIFFGSGRDITDRAFRSACHLAGIQS